MPEIKLHRRYPDSRPEDITDAYMRGVKVGIEITTSQHDRRIDALERRIERIEKLLSHKTGKHDSNQEEQGGADEPADD